MSDNFGWSTWTAERPAEFTHLPSGFRVTPVLYSDRANAATALPAGDLLRYGRRGMRDGHIAFSTDHEDTKLDWACRRTAEDQLDLTWTCRATGEWGLRYWVSISLSGPEGAEFTYDRETGETLARVGDEIMRIRCAEKPFLVTVHDDVEGLIAEFDNKGYFYLASRGTTGRFLALRFNLDEMPQMQVTVTRDGQPEEPFDASDSLPEDTDLACNPQAALQAVNDVLAWNHVMDRINDRPYTALTRNWSVKKFGGFGVWLNDNLFHALMWSMIDPAKARDNIEAVFAWQTPAGNFPCLVTGNDAWLDRTQLPIGSHVLWQLYRSTDDLDVLRWAFPKLLANHRWWWAKRSLGETRLVAYGTSADQGDGLYKGTRLAAKNESSMDNMAVHDEADFDPETGLLQSADVGLNSLLALDGEVLSHMATLLGLEAEATELAESSARHKVQIGSWLWDETRGVFANRRLDGRFVQALAPTSFYPLAAGIGTEAQLQSLIDNYLLAEDKFGGRYILPSAPRDQPAYHENVYWRGRAWAPLNYWVYQGLMRHGRVAEASDLADKGATMFAAHWDKRQCGENYSSVTGEIRDQADTDAFYTWGALLPTLSVLQVVSDTVWGGLQINPARVKHNFGPLQSQLGTVEVTREGDSWTLLIGGNPVLTGTGAPTLGNPAFGTDGFTADLTGITAMVTLEFCGRQIVSARLDGAPLAIEAGQLALTAGGKLDVTFAPAKATA
ncbi:trehalase family glycosidase [Sedimentitalea sp. XS_ASV28]|uniref:MGH1-like glycoside hydrolase domain-containing protein n=1 Tax=Sedimentitalea sp. XS_ASV28 TaxID=3241296 RepID=UPI00351665A6